MLSRWLPALITAALALALLVCAPVAWAETPTPTDTPLPSDTPTPTDTLTPTPTGTPAYIASYTLDSGNELVVERRWSFGELAIFLAILGHGALNLVMWIYGLARREGHDVQEVRIVD